MFPSSSNSCSNPFSYTYEWSFANDDVSPNISRPAEEHTGSSFLHFPSPFLGNDELLDNHFFSQHQLSAAFEAAEDEINTVQQPRLEQTQDRKGTTGKKDRHSKIYTAHGPRDRRMRLSLQIARKFFDLQDMLGFDKASNTIEWLFAKSKTAIIELIGSLPQVKPNNYSVSECEEGTSNDIMGNCDTFVGVQNDRKCRKSMFRLPVSKICRDKARARARERTREKKYFRSLEKSKQGNDANPNYLEQAAALLFELGEASTSPSQDMNYSSQKAANEEPVFTHLLLDHQMGTASESRDGTYCNEDFMGFQDDWSMENDLIQPYYDHIDSYFTGDLHQPNLSFTVSIPEN